MPRGAWPSVWILTIALALGGGVSVIGYVALNAENGDSEFLPAIRVPWFAESVIHYGMEYARQSDEYNDVVFMGGSGALAGIATKTFERQTGLRAYNLGNINDLGPAGHLEMVRNYLEAHPEPELLVYVAFPPDLGDEGSGDIELWERFVRAYSKHLETDEPKPPSARRLFQAGFWSVHGFVRGGFKHPYDAARGARPTHREVGPLLTEERRWAPYPQMRSLDLRYLDALSSFAVSQW